MPYHQSTDTDHYKVENQLLNGSLSLFWVQVCKKAIYNKTVSQRVYYGKQSHKGG